MYTVHAAYRRTCGPGRLAWSKGRRPPGAVATFIAWTVHALVIGFLCYGALEIVGVIIIIIIIICLSLCQFVKLCICGAQGQVTVGGWQLYHRVPRMTLPIHFFRHFCCRTYSLATKHTQKQTAEKVCLWNMVLSKMKCNWHSVQAQFASARCFWCKQI